MNLIEFIIRNSNFKVFISKNQLVLKLKKIISLIGIVCCFSVYSQENNIQLEGSIVDETGSGIPYAAISITKKHIGTASNDEGRFYLALSKSNLLDTLEISSIGYKSFKIKIEDFIKKEDKTIILYEDVVSLSEVNILKPKDYVKNAFKYLNRNTLSDKHQLNILYRRFSVENNMARFFVEHYLKVLDDGPRSSELLRIEVAEGRQSADYRFISKKQNKHAINYMVSQNVLRSGISINQYQWKKTGDTSYDGEDIVIVEGKKGENDYLRFYIGIKTYSIYKIETSNFNAIYIYKKDENGKLYLSYHNREWISYENIDDVQKILLKIRSNKIKLSYRHEVFVLGIENDKEIMNLVKDFGGYGNDMGDVKVKYDAVFWSNLSLPPETAFFKKNVKELESIYGVPLETQFKVINK